MRLPSFPKRILVVGLAVALIAPPVGITFLYHYGLSLTPEPLFQSGLAAPPPDEVAALWRRWDGTTNLSLKVVSPFLYARAALGAMVFGQDATLRHFNASHPGFLACQHIANVQVSGVSPPLRALSRGLASVTRAIWLTEHWSLPQVVTAVWQLELAHRRARELSQHSKTPGT
jgi:hypothetical protein